MEVKKQDDDDEDDDEDEEAAGASGDGGDASGKKGKGQGDIKEEEKPEVSESSEIDTWTMFHEDVKGGSYTTRCERD